MTGPPVTDEDLVAEAEAIAEAIWDARFDLPGEETRWIGYNSSRGKPVLMGRDGIFGGQMGIAVYFAATYAVTGDQRYRRFAETAASGFRERDPAALIANADLGAGTGTGSYIYGLTLLWQLLDDPVYRELAREFVQALSGDAIAADGRYDVLCGAAGTVLALLAYREATGEDALGTAIDCGDHLLDNRIEKWNGYEIWDTSRENQPGRIRTGMAHGAGGIAYALYRLFDHADLDRYRRAAEDALSFEDFYYAEYEGNWKANPTTVDHYPAWWCYGLVGIGLARLGSHQHHPSDRLARDLDRARRGVDPQLLADDSVCHGTFGQVDFLVELGRRDDPEYAEMARDLAGRGVERRREAGSYRVAFGDVEGLYNPAFFLGTAGIGYTLLRLVAPETIPCLLRFE